MLTLRPGDVVLTKGTGRLARLIRFFTRRIGEPRSRVNHAAVVVVGGPLDKAIIVEALQHVVRRKLVDGYTGKSAGDVAIFQPRNLSVNERWAVAVAANDYVGKGYGYVKILLHLADWALQGAYVFRRLGKMENYPICSWLVAQAFAKVGKHFGVAPGAATPDDIWDFCNGNPDKYELVHPLGKLKVE